jgi:acetyltransferase
MKKKGISLDELLAPRGVAVVGASGPGKLGFSTIVLQGLKDAGFPAIYPVNPKYGEVLGLRCYPDLASIPGVVDHVVVNIPAASPRAASQSAQSWNGKCCRRLEPEAFASSVPIAWACTCPRAVS